MDRYVLKVGDCVYVERDSYIAVGPAGEGWLGKGGVFEVAAVQADGTHVYLKVGGLVQGPYSTEHLVFSHVLTGRRSPPPPMELCSSTHELLTTGELIRCECEKGHPPTGRTHGRGPYQWTEGGATSEVAKLGQINPPSARCKSTVRDHLRAQEFRCQYSVEGHAQIGRNGRFFDGGMAHFERHAHFAPNGDIRYWGGPEPYEHVPWPYGPNVPVQEGLGPKLRLDRERGLVEVDDFADAALEPNWKVWDPEEITLAPFERWAKCGPDCPCESNQPLPPDLSAPTTYTCAACSAIVAVGSAHRCEGTTARPMRSAGPLGETDGWGARALARRQEQERIESWDEIYDDHLPPAWARRSAPAK